ncbi:hypothetical protein IQ249_25465 [Lusitaniella coriacea LEGE 07157]|uniref:Uncharacterized protein n=1 Tax=Lusitaniella coriacea LEGE 07157 TaxID=945747 RepID=A0A8J7IYX3_9CYAN|nr:hypothetical protein [Lusitaniella coriacea]MBE9119200.1 hypothetical protein [Lusitaniella coriacea LEGE 07157]MBE9119203.1 hypothetical protein [Lusitaniella coriacea LEGE 07157]
MAKSKYCPEIVECLCGEIAANGLIVGACRVAGISQDTFFNWVKRHSDFSEKIEAAKTQFRHNRPTRQKILATNAITEALEGKREIRWNKHKVVTTERRDVQGNLLFTDTVITEEDNVQYMPVPSWVFDKVLPKPIHGFEELLLYSEKIGCAVNVVDGEKFAQVLIDSDVGKLFLDGRLKSQDTHLYN